MTALIARLAYATLWRLLTPLLLARLWWRGRREPGYRQRLGERLGFGPRTVPGAVWVHAVSLGETRAAAALVAALRERRPGVRLLLTHGTATGRAVGAALLQPGDHQAWLPVDTPGAVRRFLRRHRPAVGVLMETEVWPVLLHEAGRASVPMVLANARLSERSAAKGRRLATLLRPAAERLAVALAQTPADAERLRAAGVRQVQVMGNLKYDVRPDAAQAGLGSRWKAGVSRPVVVAASTREGEEAGLLAAWVSVGTPRPLLLIVPRHPQRFDDVAALVGQQGLRVSRRSDWGPDGPGPHDAQADVWLGDSLGEMPLYFALADVGLQGGSFGPYGSHNFIEAAACGCPMVLGPSVFNFAEAAREATASGVAWQVADLPAAPRQVQLALGAAATLAAARAAARRFMSTHGGAAGRMADRVLQLIPPG
ncbi:MAG: 3-deoxy-D-manno-octulosonic acid transferase [Burkholderiales bacterium]|nr:3-deoxy-D-manno-octulosonic acid transferase [Burkholderiales bacterium]